MPVHEAIQFWKHYYSQVSADSGGCHHAWEGNEKRYQYGIRHLYGLEGSHINYRAHWCVSLQVSRNLHLHGASFVSISVSAAHLENCSLKI